MIIRFLAILFCFNLLLSAAAKAASPCDILLTAFNDSSADTSSSPAEVYIKLIEYYLNQSKNSELENLEVIKSILSAKKLVNPFLKYKDTVSIQVAAAIKQLNPQLDEQDWPEIQKGIEALETRRTSEQNQRAEKKEETKLIFNPKVVHKMPLDGSPFANGAAWQTVGERIFVAAGGGERLHVYELISEKLVEIGSMQITTYPSTPAWQIVNGRVLLAVTSLFRLSIFELMTDKVEFRGTYSIGYEDTSSLSWLYINGRTLIAVGPIGGHVHLFELQDDLILRAIPAQKISEIETLGSKRSIAKISSHSWQTFNKNLYLALGTVEKKLELYKLVGDNLELVDSVKTANTFMVGPSWQVIDDQAFVTISSLNGQIMLFEVVDEKLKYRNSMPLIAETYGVPSWHKINNRWLIAMGTRSNQLDFFELDGSRLKRFDSIPHSSREAFPSWLTIDDRTFIAFTSNSDRLHIYELLDNKFVERTKLIITPRQRNIDELRSSPTWQVIGNTAYIALGAYDKNLHLIKIFTEPNTP